VTTIDRSYTALGTGVLALWMGLTDAMLKYLRPSMRPWVVSAGVGLAVIGLYGIVRARQLAAEPDDHEEHASSTRRSRIAWLLVVPVVAIILFGPQAMGEFAVARSPHLPSYAFDIAAYAAGTGQRAPTLKMSDLLEGIEQRTNRDYLATHDVTLTGFVSFRSVSGRDSFVLTRYLISCCAADAQALSVTIVGAGPLPQKGQWLNVVARLQSTGATSLSSKYGPTLRFESMKQISAPAAPYETLR
jgi:uncharacterized repeat protein (TIGR03943 family)